MMASRLNPYISFKSNAREAMEFYQGVFGGSLDISTFGDMGQPDSPEANLVMHAMLTADNGLTLMGADTPSHMEYTPPAGISVSLSGDAASGDELRGWWEQLSGDGIVTVALEKQMWGDDFGMCIDRFGISWMVNITAA
jgi:PhnB protein